MFEKLIFVLAALTLISFFINIFYNGNTVKSCLLFMLSGLPLMNLKITAESFGGFKTFDFICFYSLIFLLKDFTTIDLKARKNVYFFLFVGLTIILILSGLTSEFPESTWLNLFRFISIFIFGRFLIITSLRDPLFFPRVIKALKTSYLFALAFLGAQVVFGLGFTFYPTLGPNTIDPIFQIVRFPGIFYDSQAHGQYLAMGSFLFLYVADGTSKRIKTLNYGVVLLSIVALALAGSRAPIGGFLVGILFIVFMVSGKYRIYGSLFIILAFAAYLSISPQSGIFQRTTNLSEDYKFRETLWDEAIDIANGHPILGIGAGNYQGHVLRHNQNQYLEIEEGILLYFDQPENGYLKILVEFGFIGFGLFIVMLLNPLIVGAIGYFKKVFDHKIIFLMAMLISWMVAFSTVYSIYDYRIMIMVATSIVLIICYPKKTTHGAEK